MIKKQQNQCRKLTGL